MTRVYMPTPVVTAVFVPPAQLTAAVHRVRVDGLADPAELAQLAALAQLVDGIAEGRHMPAEIKTAWAQLTAALELVDGAPVRPGGDSERLAEVLRLTAQHVVDGGQLEPPVGLRFGELVLLLAAASSPIPDPSAGGGW